MRSEHRDPGGAAAVVLIELWDEDLIGYGIFWAKWSSTSLTSVETRDGVVAESAETDAGQPEFNSHSLAVGDQKNWCQHGCRSEKAGEEDDAGLAHAHPRKELGLMSKGSSPLPTPSRSPVGSMTTKAFRGRFRAPVEGEREEGQQNRGARKRASARELVA